jgi:hypothetical protein
MVLSLVYALLQRVASVVQLPVIPDPPFTPPNFKSRADHETLVEFARPIRETIAPKDCECLDEDRRQNMAPS